MKKSTFEMLLIGLSAPMAGIGLAMFEDGVVGAAFMLFGASMKMIVAYFRTPKELFDWENFNGSFEEFKNRMMKIEDELENEKPLLKQLSDLSTYMMLGGFLALLVTQF